MKKLFIAILTCHASLSSVGQEVVGTVADKSSGTGVPFATIHIEGTSIGTCTNLEGKFQLKIPNEFQTKSLLISSMGYETTRVNIKESLSTALSIELNPSVVQLQTVTVRPTSAEDYIKNAVDRFSQNFGSEFSANVYFRQYASDYGSPLQFAEGFMQATFADFLNDTSEIDQRLLLHNVEDNQDVMRFRKKKREKKLEKAREVAIKEGIELNEDSVKRKAGKVGIDLLSPDLLMDQDPVRQLESFLDSTKFKKYNYQFEPDLTYQGRRVTVISFRSKNKAKLANVGLKGPLSGTLFFDYETDALIGADYDSEMVIPMTVKPLLFLAGFSVANPSMQNKVRYLQVNGRWYPHTIQIDMTLDLTQRYLFKKNEKSSIDLELLMSISSIETDYLVRIPEEFKFSRKKKFEEQVYPLADSSWDSVNRIALEEIK